MTTDEPSIFLPKAAPKQVPFDVGYVSEPYCSLCQRYPAGETYPAEDFQVEWGPVFHRGRLDGSARVLVLGLAPGHLEIIARRILMGIGGQRIQGFLAKLGITRSYVMLNTYLYPAAGHQGPTKHQHNPQIVSYRNEWMDAVMTRNDIQAVMALGARADGAWATWRQTELGQKFNPAYVKITHPTQPDTAFAGKEAKKADATAALLENWNAALSVLREAVTPVDAAAAAHGYGSCFAAEDILPIPAYDLPAGTPGWMASSDGWAVRAGEGRVERRGNILVSSPVVDDVV